MKFDAVAVAYRRAMREQGLGGLAATREPAEAMRVARDAVTPAAELRTVTPAAERPTDSRAAVVDSTAAAGAAALTAAVVGTGKFQNGFASGPLASAGGLFVWGGQRGRGAGLCVRTAGDTLAALVA